jgi:hypothetical protein
MVGYEQSKLLQRTIDSNKLGFQYRGMNGLLLPKIDVLKRLGALGFYPLE